MPRTVNRDSMSRCEQPSMLFDTVRNPHARRVAPKVVVGEVSKDTLESTQKRLNRQMFERVQNLGLRLPHDSFVAVVHVGKYVFLAVMLPPYLCLYGIPRWMLVTAFPAMFDFAKQQTLRFGQFLQTLSISIVDLMKGILEQTLGDSLRTAKQYARNSYHTLMRAFEQVSAYAGEKLKQVQAIVQGIQQATSQFLDRVRERVNKVREQIASKIITPVQTMVNHLVQLSSTLVSRLNSVIQYGKTLPAKTIENVKNQYRNVAEKASEAYKVLSSFISNSYGAVGQLFASALEKGKELVNSIVVTPLEIAREKILSANRKIKETANAVKEKVKKYYETIVEKTKETAQTVVDISIKIARIIPDLFVQLPAWVWGFTPAPVKTTLRGLLGFASRFKRSLKNFSKARQAIAGACRRVNQLVVNWVRTFIIRLAALLKQFFAWLIKQILGLPRRMIKGIKRVGSSAVSGAKKLGRGSQLAIAVIWAVISFGYLLAKELLREVSHWLPGQKV